MKKSFYLVMLIFLLIGVSFALEAAITNFNSEENPFNISFEGEDNHTYYLKVPTYSYVKNLTITIEGLTP